jgi:UDP-N-acetylglucosamine 4,6-dehydratase
MTKALISGGTGSLGTALVPVFLQQGYEVTILSRDFHKQEKLLAQHPSVRAILADICDRDAMLRACEGQDIVVHAAALKAVNRGETDTRMYHRVNVLGTLNVAEACRINGIDKALFISSDKACASATRYGTTKKIGEDLWLAEQTTHNITKFSCVRYGNVVASNGSVWHVWQDRIAKGLPLIVREPEPTRFFLSLADAVKIVTDALRVMNGSEVFVPSYVPSFSLWDLARKLQPESQWQKEPLGATEKQHEILVAPTEFVEPIFGQNTDLWRVLPRVSPKVQQTMDMFCSATPSLRLSADEVIKRLQA